jgi:tetratricopeptide (TPR) repeat protein
VTTQLIDVAADRHLWAQNYDRNLDDIFEVQSDVARQVADALKVRILAPEKERMEKPPTESIEAYTLYLKGRQLWNKRGLNNVKEALAYFEQAVKEDPGFALGYVGQADSYIVALLPRLNETEAYEKAKPLIAKALELNPDLAEAHTTNGMILKWGYDLRHAEDEFKKAIELKPSYATTHQWYATLLREELRWDEALKEIEKAVELDPLSGIIMFNLGVYYYWRRDFSRAAEKCRIAVELGSEDARAYLADAYGRMKMFDQMDKEWEACARYFQDTFPGIKSMANLYCAYCKGDKETVRRLLPELEAHPKEAGTTATYIAGFHLFLGNVDKCFEWLERAYSRRETSLLGIQSDWDLDGVRNDPRYLDLLKRLGLD